MLDMKLNDYQLQQVNRYMKMAGVATAATVLAIEPALADQLDTGIKTVTTGANKMTAVKQISAKRLHRCF